MHTGICIDITACHTNKISFAIIAKKQQFWGIFNLYIKKHSTHMFNVIVCIFKPPNLNSLKGTDLDETLKETKCYIQTFNDIYDICSPYFFP